MPPIIDTDPVETISHVWTPEQRCTVDAALAANRPMLVAGEPGIGKTQLAWETARELNRPLVTFTVDSRTESRDLLYEFDAVQRLAEAQVLSSLYKDDSKLEQMRQEIAVSNFVHPGPMWWAINWTSAEQHLRPGQHAPTKIDGSAATGTEGVVVLIDEIDKADSDVPNGLLEAFAMRQFTPPGFDEAVAVDMENVVPRPLVIVTTNRERMLPDPFIRRCFVLNLKLPEEKNEKEFKQYLKDRGEVHFKKSGPELLGSDEAFQALLDNAAGQLRVDRIEAKTKQTPPWPGVAEYLDFLRAILQQVSDGKDPEKVYEAMVEYGVAFRKQTGVDP